MTPQEETVQVTHQLNQAMREHLELVKAQNDSLPGVTDSAGGLSKSLGKAGIGQSKVAETAMLAAKELEKMYQVSTQYRLAMAKGEKGSAKYNAHVDQMADTTQKVIVGLSTFAATLIGGPVLGAVVAGFTMLATNSLKTAAALQKSANEQGDALSKSFQDMSEAGATASDGMGGLFKDVQRMRLNVYDLGSYTAMMAESAKELTAMGGTSREGAKQLADLTANLSDFEKGMRGLGMNNEKQAEAIMGFMKNQSNISRGQQKDYGNQSAAAKKYIEETEVLTKVTGLNRKQQQDIQERQMSQQRSGAVLRELALAGETDKIRLIQNQTKIYAKMGPEAEQGYNDILSGQINTEAAQKLNMITQGKVMQDQQDIMEGRVKTDQEAAAATEGTAKVMGQVQDSMLGLAKSGGFEDVFGPFKNASEAGKIAANDLAENVAKAAAEVDKLTGAVAGIDEETERRIKFDQTQREEMTKEQAALANKWMDAGFTIENEAKLLAGMFGEMGKIFKDTLTGIFGDQTKQFEEYGKQQEARKKKEQEDSDRYAKENEKMWQDFNKTLTVAGTNITTWAGGVNTGFLKAVESAEKGMGKFSDKLVEMVSDIWKKLVNLIPGLGKAAEVVSAGVDKGKEYAQKSTDTVKGAAGEISDWLSKEYAKTGWGDSKKPAVPVQSSAPAAPAGGKIPGGGQITDPNAADYNATYAEHMREFGGAPAPAQPAPAQSAQPAPAQPAPVKAPKGSAARSTPAPAPAAQQPARAQPPAPPVDMPYTSGNPAPAQPATPAQPAKPAQPVSTYSERLLNYIKSTERFTPTAFWDKKQWTNGYGTKAKSPAGGSDDPGPKETVNESTALSRMTDYLQNAVTGVVDYGKKKGYQWTQGQVDALTSFSYNLGIGKLNQITDDGKRSNEEIAAKLLAYNKAVKKDNPREYEELPGLTKRRQEELAMFQAKDGGVFDGPKSGYAATLHGNEAVIPLKDGAVPVSMSQEFNMTATNLGELVNQMKYNMAVQERMVTVLEEIRRAQTTTADNTGRMVAYASN